MQGFCPLASGSKGNCTYLGTPETKILIDAGISGKAVREKLAQIGVALEEIDAILITHDHGDHIAGLKTLAFRYQIPILANTETAKGIVEYLYDCPKFKIFSTGEPFGFKDLEIQPFSIPHDTLDPVAFSIQTQGLKIGICTDLGFVTKQVQHHLKGCDYLMIEANHDIQLVHQSTRPYIYKQRVLGKNGHLSNPDCASLLKQIAHPDLKHIFLAHLSSECNRPELALETIRNTLAEHGIDLKMTVAPQDQISLPVYF